MSLQQFQIPAHAKFVPDFIGYEGKRDASAPYYKPGIPGCDTWTGIARQRFDGRTKEAVSELNNLAA